MPEPTYNLGRMTKVFGIQPAYLQRAVFVAVLSFLFFLAMMFAFYLRQHFGYFLLATAFLLVYLATMFSWVTQRKSVVKLFENGFEYRKFSCRWDELEAVSRQAEKKSIRLQVRTKTGQQVTLPGSIEGIDEIERFVLDRISR